mmetsp:Transcript_35443/g.31941  ORF Transcript_35443/g.31941 Transcript_35443/m.31941 type:complete len:202 (+) Transcript_35443:376-981(+)
MKTFLESDKEDQKEYYQRENHLSQLSHPNIISCYGSKSYSNSHLSYILMEYAPNGSLDSHENRNKLLKDEKLVRSYFHQLISGLEYLHSENIAHLDLKPENLLLDQNYVLKIADFDLSQYIDEKYILGGGTESYRAPEVIAGVTEDSTKADTYSAGIVLFKLMTGIMPYSEDYDNNEQYMFHLMLKEQDKFWIEIAKKVDS